MNKIKSKLIIMNVLYVSYIIQQKARGIHLPKTLLCKFIIIKVTIKVEKVEKFQLAEENIERKKNL